MSDVLLNPIAEILLIPTKGIDILRAASRAGDIARILGTEVALLFNNQTIRVTGGDFAVDVVQRYTELAAEQK